MSTHVDFHDGPQRLDATEPTRAGRDEEWLEAELLHLPETGLRVMRCVVVEHEIDWSTGVRLDGMVQLWQEVKQTLRVSLVLQVDESTSLETGSTTTVN